MMLGRKRKNSTEDQHVGHKRARSTKDQEKEDEDLVSTGGSEANLQSANLESSGAVSLATSGIRNFLRELHSPKDAEIESVNTCPDLVDSIFFSGTN